MDFKLEDIPSRMSGGSCDPWRELTIIAQEIMKIKKELAKLQKHKKKKDSDE